MNQKTRRFTSKRGRPKTIDNNIIDKGSWQLQARKKLGQTTEALDLCFQKGIISENELWAGGRLRWLYSIKFGSPNISAVDLRHFYGHEIKITDPDWQERREDEYREAIRELKGYKLHKLVINVAIFNHRLEFLNGGKVRYKDTKDLRDGLDLLCELWGRQNLK